MKKVFNILKPIFAYWITVIIFYVLSFFEVFGVFGGESPWIQSVIFFAVVFSISTILIGYFEKAKDVLCGLVILEIQLIVSSVLQILLLYPNKELNILDNIIVCSNMMFSAFFTEHNALNTVLSAIFPVVTTAVGIGIAKISKHNRT